MNTRPVPFYDRTEFKKAVDACLAVAAICMIILLVAEKKTKMEETDPTNLDPKQVLAKESIDFIVYWTTVILLGFVAIIYIRNCVHVVKPSRRMIIMSLEGEVRILESGLRFFLFPWWMNYGAGPFYGIISPYDNYHCPVQNTKVLIDPKASQIHTSQGIQCDIDVRAEARILQWGKEILNETGRFKDLAATRINDWVSQTLGRIDADSITYNNVSRILNEPSEIEKLNASLRPFYVAVDRISLDPNGIKMSRAYTVKREEINTKMQILDAKERELKREMEISELEHRAKMKQQTFENERIKASKDAELQIARSQQESLQVHIHDLMENCKLQPEQVIPLVIAEIGAKSIRETPNISKMVVVPSSSAGYPNGNIQFPNLLNA